MITSQTITAGTITTGVIGGGPRIEFYPDGGYQLFKRSEGDVEGEDMHPGSFTLQDRHGDAFISVVPHARPGKVTVKTSPEGITLTRPMLEMLTKAMEKGRDYKGPDAD